MKPLTVLPLPALRELRTQEDADADYERVWRSRLLRNAKYREAERKVTLWQIECEHGPLAFTLRPQAA